MQKQVNEKLLLLVRLSELIRVNLMTQLSTLIFLENLVCFISFIFPNINKMTVV